MYHAWLDLQLTVWRHIGVSLTRLPARLSVLQQLWFICMGGVSYNVTWLLSYASIWLARIHRGGGNVSGPVYMFGTWSQQREHIRSAVELTCTWLWCEFTGSGECECFSRSHVWLFKRSHVWLFKPASPCCDKRSTVAHVCVKVWSPAMDDGVRSKHVWLTLSAGICMWSAPTHV